VASRPIGIIIEGATGRLGTTQHLRSLMVIRNEGGLALADGDRLVPDPVLLGRNPAKLAALAAAHGGLKWSTERDAALGRFYWFKTRMLEEAILFPQTSPPTPKLAPLIFPSGDRKEA
jgi:hypothetical protein